MGILSWLFGEKPRSADTGAQASRRPAWAVAMQVSSEPIVMFSALTPENIVGKKALQQQMTDAPLATNSPLSKDLLQPVAGRENAVPWPTPLSDKRLPAHFLGNRKF